MTPLFLGLSFLGCGLMVIAPALPLRLADPLHRSGLTTASLGAIGLLACLNGGAA